MNIFDSDLFITKVVVDGVNGVFVPQTFVIQEDAQEWGMTEEEEEILFDGPTNEEYWETWNCFLQTAERNGWFLFHDEDLYAYRERE